MKSRFSLCRVYRGTVPGVPRRPSTLSPSFISMFNLSVNCPSYSPKPRTDTPPSLLHTSNPGTVVDLTAIPTRRPPPQKPSRRAVLLSTVYTPETDRDPR